MSMQDNSVSFGLENNSLYLTNEKGRGKYNSIKMFSFFHFLDDSCQLMGSKKNITYNPNFYKEHYERFITTKYLAVLKNDNS